MLDCAYFQHVDFATFIKANQVETNCLDYVISDSQNRISNIVKGPILGQSDQGHLTLEWHFIIKPEKSTVSHRYISDKLDYRKRDYINMNFFSSKFNWDRHFENKCADEAYDLFRIVCNFSCSKFVPMNKNKPYKSRWINKGIKERIKL